MTEQTPLRNARPLGQARPSRCADSGVSAAGRPTKAQPAASAGPALRVIIALGKFHGVIDAATPIGCLITVIRLSRWWPGIVSP